MVTVSPPQAPAGPLAEATPWAYALQLPHDARAPRVARRPLRALEGGQRLRVSVWDSNPHIPPPFRGTGVAGPCPVPGAADGGRGLFLVCHDADAWGGYPLGDDLFGRGGKPLWCEVGRHAGRPAADG
ncbi:ATP-binding protein [Streptomyces sp. NPDC046465]|uniref:ATP-binding protein n=1 Tax=Streptomyces sp. NPDC046465 TaxID=3155810 RepID=UPI0033D7A98B